jgi:hypothetical protein
MGGNTARKALPSESLGNAAATSLLVLSWAWILFHIGMKASTRCSAPRKYITTYLAFSVACCGLPFGNRLRYHDSHGMFEHTSGVPRVSAVLATAFTVSGVLEASSMSTWSALMACWASCPARVGLDWVS